MRASDYNYTHNVTAMWKACGVYDALYNSDGERTETVIPILRAGIAFFEEHYSEMEALNPPNGWGHADTALEFLRKVADGFASHPGIVGVSK